jgi:hypothetical protein
VLFLHILTLLASLLLAPQSPLLATDALILPNIYVPLYEQIFTSNEAPAAKRGAFNSVKARDARSIGKRRWRYHRIAAGICGTSR